MTEERLTKLAESTEVPNDKVADIYEQYREEYGKDELAFRKTYNEVKRRVRRMASMETYRGYILGEGQVRDVSSSPNVAKGELLVKNAVGVLENGKLFTSTLWDEAAKHLRLPKNVLVEFKARPQEETTKSIDLNIPAETSLAVLDENSKNLDEFKEDLRVFKPKLKDLEDYYADSLVDIVLIEASIIDVAPRPSEKGNWRVSVDDMSGFDEDYTTTILVPDELADGLTQDKELLVLGRCWKPDTSWDPETRSTIDEPGRVIINALAIQLYEFGELEL